MSSDIFKVMMLGDMIGEPGVSDVVVKIGSLRNKEKLNLIVVNGENSDKGFGITEEIVLKLKQAGVDVITTGNHVWSNRDHEKLLADYASLLRPANYPSAPGKGFIVLQINGIEVAVVNLQGRYSMIPIDCPFQVLSKLLKNELKKSDIIIVDFHAEYSAEKKTLAVQFDGKVSLVAGTHTHVQTADETILKNGTGFITDLGICGGLDSIIGMEKDGVIEKILSQSNVPFVPSRENIKIQGIIAEIDKNTKRAISIKRLSI